MPTPSTTDCPTPTSPMASGTPCCDLRSRHPCSTSTASSNRVTLRWTRPRRLPILLKTKTLECSTDDGSNSVFEGALSRLPLWSRPLSAEEMYGHDCGEGPFPGLVGYWPLEENATGTLVAEVGTAGTHHEMASLSEASPGFCGCTVVDSSSSRWPHPVRSRHGLGRAGTCVSECTKRRSRTMWPSHRLGPGQRGVHHRHPDRQRPRRLHRQRRPQPAVHLRHRRRFPSRTSRPTPWPAATS